MRNRFIAFTVLVLVACSFCTGCTSKEKEAEIKAEQKAEQNTKAFTEGNKDLGKDIPTKGTDKIGQKNK